MGKRAMPEWTTRHPDEFLKVGRFVATVQDQRPSSQKVYIHVADEKTWPKESCGLWYDDVRDEHVVVSWDRAKQRARQMIEEWLEEVADGSYPPKNPEDDPVLEMERGGY